MERINNEVRKRIKLNTQLDVIQFTHAAAKCKGEVDCLEENRNINGKKYSRYTQYEPQRAYYSGVS